MVEHDKRKCEVEPIGGTEDPEGPTLLEPPRAWQFLNIRELWKHRELVFLLIWRDVSVRYKQTVLGAAWAVLQPAMMMVVFTLFFGRMAGVPSGGIPYPLFAYAGLLPWSFFATALANAGNSVVGSERLISKIYFPRLAVPLAAVGAAVVDFAVAFGLLMVLMIYYRVSPGPGLLVAPLIFGMIVVAAVGVGTLLAALNVAYRDFRYVIPFLIQLWMFATPSVYMQVAEPSRSAGTTAAPTEDRAPSRGQADPSVGDRHDEAGSLQAAVSLNPMTALIAAFRASVLDGPIPWWRLGIASACVFPLALAGCLYFRKVEDNFADII